MLLKANIMLLITEPTVANLRDAGRLIHFSHKEAQMDRSILVMNKYGQHKKNELDIQEFETILKRKVNHTILYDNLFPMEFTNQGKMMENEKNPTAQSIREIMDDILGMRPKTEKKSWFGKLFRD
jgi:Flp pilus assembly CpaE family ATPase